VTAAAAVQAIDPRSVPVRFSRLRLMARSALHYYDALQDPTDYDSLARRIGRGTHALVLGQPVVVFRGAVRRGKEWDAFRLEHAGEEILNETEYERSHRIASAIHNHDDAKRLLFGPGVQLEKHLAWTLDGRACSSRPDAFTHDTVAELKTARTCEPDKFIRDAQRSGYHAQLSFYMAALESFGIVKPQNAVIISVESERPHSVVCYELTARAIDIGTSMWRLWWERLRVCEESGCWPGYSESVLPFDCEAPLELEGLEDEQADAMPF
jgi:hypothetical protein